jgi:hypothetical protein
MTRKPLREPGDVLYRIKRGLSGYVSYLAACEMNASFSEYVLYEPILRILTGRGFLVRCEVPCPGMPKQRTGDYKRIDFVAEQQDVRFALEVKWAKASALNVSSDHTKLAAFLDHCATPNERAFLCIFGRQSHIRNVALRPNAFHEVGDPVIADFRRTRYGCRILELRSAGRLRKRDGRSRSVMAKPSGR